jgi:AcrR family transcriptional regulator
MGEETTRDAIVATADRLIYEGGYEATSFAAIAGAVGISRGNVTYYFPSKDAVLDAVISARLAQTEGMLDRWEAEGETPGDRIRSFIHILLANRTGILRHGCPVGTLTSELAKLDHVARGQANGLFTLFRVWLRRQFERAGAGAEADVLAMHLLVLSQGIATLANAFGDEAFLQAEVHRAEDWLAVELSRITSASAA